MEGKKVEITSEYMISVKNIYKTFGTNEVLKGISLDVKPGEVMALIGGNGAGKSTLMKIIMGIYQADAGEIIIAGEKINMKNPSVALAEGVYLVPQEPMLFPNMTVEENILMGFQEKQAVLKSRLQELMKKLNWEIGLRRKANSLSIAEQQLVEIMRGLMRQARILILDEPTSSLTFDEVAALFKVVEELKKQGISIIYITHRLTEVFDIATDVAIMRDGVVTLNGPVKSFTREILVKGLLPPGAESIREGTEKKILDYKNLKPVLEVDDLSGYGFSNISLKVYPGEILGVAGVVGAGRTELVSTIFGRDKVLKGHVYLDGREITGLPTRKIIESGINYVPEDRHYNGLYKISSVAANTTSALLEGQIIGKLWLNNKKEYEITQQYVEDFRTMVVSYHQPAGSLSGGNQQKVVLGRALSTYPKLVILDEPTRGIDAAARADVYHIIEELRDQGVAVLLVSSDMEEIMELSDRAVTVFQGRINGEFSRKEITQDHLTSAAFGMPEERGKEA